MVVTRLRHLVTSRAGAADLATPLVHSVLRTPRPMEPIGGSERTDKMHWGRILLGGFVAELLVFAIVFPVLHLFGQHAFLVSIPIASAVMPFLLAIWVGRRVTSRFVLHGVLVGAVAALVYIALAWGQPQPLLYQISHALKIAGGLAGGVVTSRWQSSGLHAGAMGSE